MFVLCSNSSSDILATAHQKKHTQTIIDATQKETAIDQHQHSCETLICRRYQTILRRLSGAATASPRWRVGELIDRPRILLLLDCMQYFFNFFFHTIVPTDLHISWSTYFRTLQDFWSIFLSAQVSTPYEPELQMYILLDSSLNLILICWWK